MKGGGDIRRPLRLRLLSREELALWRHATADVDKQDRKKRRDHEPSAPSAAADAPQPPVEAMPSLARLAPQPEIEPPKPKPASLAPLAPIERRLKRRLSSGKAQVDDVLDLHGLTQAQAHRALNGFLWRSAENGAKLVLVITGKGGPPSDDHVHAAERGVLRRNAPHWLRAPELRAIVLSVEEATRTHGGAGALYVRLRRRI